MASRRASAFAQGETTGRAERGHHSRRELAMNGHLSERTRWAIVVAFAIAMAWVEAASVFYIRALVDRIEPYQANPLPLNDALGYVELWREAATLVMIATLGLLAGRTWRRRRRLRGARVRRLGHLLLRLPSPHDWAGRGRSLDWDILFLLPLAMVGAGARASQHRAADDRMGHARDAVD